MSAPSKALPNGQSSRPYTLACAFFFLLSGIGYGIFASRIPYIVDHLELSKLEVGFLLLSFSGGGFLGLLANSLLVKKFNNSTLIKAPGLIFMLSLLLSSIMPNYALVLACLIIAGFCFSTLDVCMNIQGVAIERRFNNRVIGKLHGSYSAGALLGSASGVLFSLLIPQSLLVHYLIIFAIMCLLFYFAHSYLFDNKNDQISKEHDHTNSFHKSFYLIVIVCALMVALAYSAEGVLAEWTSLYFYQELNQYQGIAALGTGVFNAGLVGMRLFVIDRLRSKFKDIYILLPCAFILCLSMLIYLNIEAIIYKLIFLVFIGSSIAPFAPILFSTVGNLKHVNTNKAFSIVAAFGYGALLISPVLIGFLATALSIAQTFYIISFYGVILFITTLRVFKNNELKK